MSVTYHDQQDAILYRGRWTMIAIIALGVLSYGLQMYCIVPAFGDIQDEFSLSLSQTSLLVSLFFFGYALAHVPVGFASAAYGAKAITVAGIGLLAVSTLIFAFADHYSVFLLSRALGGAAASMIIGAGYQLAAAWSRDNQVKLVIGGVMNGLGFTIGAAIALYFWTILVDNIGWRTSTLIAGLFGSAVAVVAAIALRAPRHLAELRGGHLSWSATYACLRSRNMWAIGLGSLGAYGTVFTASQIGPGYVESELNFSAETAGLLSTTLLVLGVPGAFIGGLVGDRVRTFLPTMKIPAALIAALCLAIPFAGGIAIWFVLGAIGFLGMFFFAAFTTVPSEYGDEIPKQDYATALGLILTLANVGAVVYPYLYALVTEQSNPAAGWLSIAGISALMWFAFILAREPRLKRTDAAGNDTRVAAEIV